MLNHDLKLVVVAKPAATFDQRCIGAGKLLGSGKVLSLALKGPFADYGVPVVFRCGLAGSNQWRPYHAL